MDKKSPGDADRGGSPEYLVLPGFGGSGPAHWQSLWEKQDASFRRVQQSDWEHPDRAAWVETLERAITASGSDGSPKATGSRLVLVAHSMACLLVAHWVRSAPPQSLRKIKAAFLVAAADPASPVFPKVATGFETLPEGPLPFPSLMVVSSDDPYGSPEFSRRCARSWGTALVDIGPKGHINSESGLGAWAEGKSLLESLLSG